jgi:hypothetical protein
LNLLFGAVICAAWALPPAVASPRHRAHAACWHHTGAASDLSPLETQVMGQNTWLRGGPAALRVIVTDHNTGKPANGEVAISLVALSDGKPSGAPRSLCTGWTGALGTLDAHFAAPNVPPGTYQVKVTVHSPLGDDTVTQPITLQESVQLLLTADKPLYQPGQTIHMRSLAIDLATRRAVGDQPVVFEVEDARGNKVFKHRDTLSRFGIAGADFVLADEVNMGLFTLRAILPTGQVEKKVRVERYVLPKFKIDVTLDKPYYLPGETVKGVIKARYFFGKPVAEAQVAVDVNTIDIGVTKLAEIKAKTDEIGAYTFRTTLPNAFVGQPFEQGKATVGFDVSVKDTADQKQEAHLSAPVVKDPVSLVLVPERKALAPDVENRVYVAAATPDGAPLKECRVAVSIIRSDAKSALAPLEAEHRELRTDEMGLAEFQFKPAKGVAYTLTATATDAVGHHGSAMQAASTDASEGLILRTDRTLAHVGDRLQLTALSSVKTGTLYLDVIRNKQTILTSAQAIQGGRSEIDLPLTADMAGTLEMHAYKILPDENIVRDTRVVIVSPADTLNVKMSADHAEYHPGGDAHLQFTVRDKESRPVHAALGLAMVDESVFALSELQPGLEQIVFTLEKELMEPRFEIHGLTPSHLILPQGPTPHDPVRQRAGAMLFSAVPLRADDEPAQPVQGGFPRGGLGGRMRGGMEGGFIGGGGQGGFAPNSGAVAITDHYFDFHINTYQARWAKLVEEVANEMMRAQQKIWDAVQRYHRDTHVALTAADSLTLLVQKGYLNEADLLDHWGHPYKTNLYGRNDYEGYFTLSSAGPDGRWNTGDDLDDLASYALRSGGGFRGGGGRIQRRLGEGGLMGGFGGGAAFGRNGAVRDEAPAAPEMEPLAQLPAGMAEGDVTTLSANSPRLYKYAAASKAVGGGGEEAPRVRQYFPETMYWNPQLITDDEGHAGLRLPLADSITTWRMSMTASATDGRLGSATAPVKVFQDFFVDLDLPVALTQHDRMTLPVTVYNYLPTAQEVTLTLQEQPWFTLTGSARQTVRVEPGQVTVVHYPIVAQAMGRHELTVTARGTRLSDAVRRGIDVLPDGKEVRTAVNDRLEGKAEAQLVIPGEAIAGASTIWVKLYPGAFSQVAEGVEGMLQMPGGCFEQTSSSTYPDVLVLDYLKATKRVNPELQMRAEQYINVGYQRLVTFECKNGGFSWFGDEPAHQILTAYGLLEFSDMARVHDVDPNVIARTQRWLAGRQQADGSWEEHNQGIAEGIINRQTGALRSTAYVAWALAESGYAGPEIGKGVGYVKAHLDEAKDPYTLAVILNLFARVERDGEAAGNVAQRLIGTAKTTEKTAWWQSDTQTFTGADRQGADLETTGLAAFGLVAWGRNGGFTNKVLTYLVQTKDSYGVWSTTQGTVWAMKSLLAASRNGVGGGRGEVTVLANGKPVADWHLTPEDSDVMRQVDLGTNVHDGANAITLQYTGEGAPLYQIVGRYYLPWERVGLPPMQEQPLSIAVKYDKTTLARDDTATVTVTIHNNTPQTAEMPLIDLGIPPGFTVVPDALEAAVAAKTISKYTLAARQIILYMEKLDGNQTVTLTYQVKARFPIKARTPLSRVYPYYNPERVALSTPQEITVQ